MRHWAAWSLRWRLIAAFALIIFLTLLLVLVGLLFVLRQYQEQREMIRLGSLVGPVSFHVRALEQQGASAGEITEFLAREADELDVRIVLARAQGAIFHDTEGSLVGQRIDLPSAPRTGALRRTSLAGAEGGQDGRPFFFVANVGASPNSRLAESPGGRPSAYVVALASEPQTIPSVLREIAPRLLVPTLLSLLASIGVAWVLAQSIAHPLARVTRAAEEISRGRYDQVIPAHGADEVGRLTLAFNLMAREVARSQRTMRDFVANVSHDLRTPLTSIQGFSRAMGDGSLREAGDYAEAGRIIIEETERMQRLVEDLLELSAIDAGRVALELAPVDLAALVNRAADRTERSACVGGVGIRRRIGATPIVLADARRLERVLDNVLANAVKHTQTGGLITLAVKHLPDRPGVEESNHTVATVSIHNTGSTIPPEELDRVFERFYRLDKSRSVAGEGVGHGLGLSIAREIVQTHGGRIVARSSPEDGTELTLEIPSLDSGCEAGLRSDPIAVGDAAISSRRNQTPIESLVSTKTA